jgi:hypothetical protein
MLDGEYSASFDESDRECGCVSIHFADHVLQVMDFVIGSRSHDELRFWDRNSDDRIELVLYVTTALTVNALYMISFIIWKIVDVVEKCLSFKGPPNL